MPQDVYGELFRSVAACNNLEVLSLKGNTLTGKLSKLDPHEGLLFPGRLELNATALNKDDLAHLTHLIERNKLPKLQGLDLNENNLCEMEDESGKLIEACVSHHQRELTLWLWSNDLSEEFKETWKERCEGTDIELKV